MFRSPGFYLPLAILLAVAGLLAAQQICLIGNLEVPVGPPVPGLVEGMPSFAYLVHPIEQCGCPEPFVQLQTLAMWLAFEPSMIPQQFVARAGIRQAVWNAALNRWAPGDYFYESQPFPIDVIDPGLFLLQVPAVNARWMDIHEYYFLTMTFESPVFSDLPVDGLDLPGIAYVSPDGDQWFDLYLPDKTSGGKPIIWGDVLCGADDGTPAPVPAASPRLEQPSPNPFNPGTSISLVMEQPGHVKLSVHDAHGGLVRVLVDEVRASGTWRFEWDGIDAAGQRSPAGIYFFRAETGSGVAVRKAALIK